MLKLAVEWGRVEKVLPKVGMLSGENHREHALILDEENRYLAAASPASRRRDNSARLRSAPRGVLPDVVGGCPEWRVAYPLRQDGERAPHYPVDAACGRAVRHVPGRRCHRMGVPRSGHSDFSATRRFVPPQSDSIKAEIEKARVGRVNAIRRRALRPRPRKV